MDLKATVANGYRIRLIIICAGALFFAAYSYYDATIAYPNAKAQFDKYVEIRDNNPKDWQEKWDAQVKANGYDEQPDEVSDGDITVQWVMFYITLPIGLYCLFSILAWSRRYLGADEDKLYAQGGVEVPFDKITSIDATRWKAKGIARVHYDIGAGTQQLVIDDWKMERASTDEIFNRIRENVDEDKIEGLDDEPDSEADDLADSDPAQDAMESDEEQAASTRA